MTEQAPPELSTTLTEQDKAAVKAVFDRVKDAMTGFRPRRSQNLMIAEVARAVGPEAGGFAVVEAGTGCGKSLGYLVPAIPLAASKGKKLVVSTGTIALQEQLLREVPELLKTIGRTEKVALAKGRQRYVCVRDLLAAAGESGQDELGLDGALFDSKPAPGEVSLIQSLSKAWNTGRWNGDMDNAPEKISESMHTVITTPPGGCSGRACAHFDQCPMVKAREAVRQADIVLVNHTLLLLDLQAEDPESALVCDPAQSILCIDEAHQFSPHAIDVDASHVPITAAIKRLRKAEKLVSMIYRAIEKEQIADLEAGAVMKQIEGVADAMEALEKQIRLQWTPNPNDRDQEWRAPEGNLPEDWRQRAEELTARLKALGIWFAAVKRGLRSKKGRYADQVRRQSGMLGERISGYMKLFNDWSMPNPDTLHPHARWITLGHENGLVCHASPTDASEYLSLLFWGRVHAAVFTSATLSAGGDFSAFNRGLALPDTVQPISLPSPFDLERQASLEVPYFHADPNQPGHPREVTDWLQRELDWAKGSLVLFTSRRKMQEVADMLGAQYRQKVKVQGEYGKAELIQRHKADVDAGTGSVLFGLQSLGEGTDLPGVYCSTVVVTQLPFGRLTDPVKATLAEWMERRGDNPFMQMTLPDAMLRLTQYAGRLIRTETDTGRIVITDSRLRTKRYGSWFLDGLPPFRRVVERRPSPSGGNPS